MWVGHSITGAQLHQSLEAAVDRRRNNIVGYEAGICTHMRHGARLGLRCTPICVVEHGQEFCGDGLGDGSLSHRLFGEAFNWFDKIGRRSLKHRAPE